MARRPTVAIVGCGRAGGSIGLALQRAGYPIAGAWSRSRAGRSRASRLLDAPVLAKIEDVVEAADAVVVAVPDDAIAEVALRAAETVRTGQIVVHTSGATSIEVLAPVRERGGRIGSLHPLQTLPDARRGADALQGAAVAVTCEEGDHPALSRLASGWGGRPFRLPDDAKPLYHAAAVFASNYVVGVVWAALELLTEVGIANPQAVVAPLVRASAENVTAKGGARAITGPVVRGDTDVLRRHVEELRARGRAGRPAEEAYRALAGLVASLAQGDVEQIRKATA